MTIYCDYQRIKSARPNEILLLRVGDFYEAFDADAKLVSAAYAIPCREIRLNHRRVSAAGVPAATVNSLVEALLRQGHTVILGEYTDQPAANGAAA